MINKWGDRFFETSRRVESDINGNWRLEGLYESIKAEAKEKTGTDNNIEDLYALYWLKRNEIIDKQCKKILFLNYSKLVTAPKHCVEIIMNHAGASGVWKYFRTDAHTSSLRRNITIQYLS